MPFADRLFEPFFYIFDPSKRIFILYSLCAFILGLVVLLKNADFKKSFAALFSRKVWLHPSSQIDMQLLFANSFFKACLFLAVTLSSLEVARQTMRELNRIFPSSEVLGWSYNTTVLAYALISFVTLDFSRFFQHYLFHKVPFLWRFHKIHHSAFVLTPMTLYRTHPVESIVSSLRRIFVIGLVSGCFLFKTRSMISGYEILGINLFDFLFNVAGSNLRHSHVWLSFGPLNSIFMSPAHHQVHHSRAKKHQDKNFGFALSIWDILFQSYYNVKKKEFLIFGVRGERYKNLWQALKAPF